MRIGLFSTDDQLSLKIARSRENECARRRCFPFRQARDDDLISSPWTACSACQNFIFYSLYLCPDNASSPCVALRMRKSRSRPSSIPPFVFAQIYATKCQPTRRKPWTTFRGSDARTGTDFCARSRMRREGWFGCAQWTLDRETFPMPTSTTGILGRASRSLTRSRKPISERAN